MENDLFNIIIIISFMILLISNIIIVLNLKHIQFNMNNCYTNISRELIRYLRRLEEEGESK